MVIVSKHVFADVTDANAFVCGVQFVNDDEVEAQDILVGTDENGAFIATVVILDGSDENDIETDGGTIDHREHV